MTDKKLDDPIGDLFGLNVTTKPPTDWMNSIDWDEKIPPEPEFKPPATPFDNGISDAKEWMNGVCLDDFKAKCGPILAWMKPGETLDLTNEIWADFIKSKMLNDPRLKFPEPFELLNGPTELWERGFQKALRNVWEHSKLWK